MSAYPSNITVLRAELAMRREDLRIALKHREEAAARTMSPANKRAYESACRWVENRREAARVAQVRYMREAS